MADVEEECVFHTGADQVRFRTRTNGDEIRILNLRLTQEQATSLAWLVNTDDIGKLEFTVKVKET